MKSKRTLSIVVLMISGFLMIQSQSLKAQDSVAVQGNKEVPKPVRDTFESAWVIDNQSVMVPSKGTLEMDIQHRFGTVNNGYEDFYGIYAPSNIRIGMSYAPIDRLNLGFGFTKLNMTWDFNAKYGIFKQSTGGWPVSITYFGNMAVDTRPNATFANSTDRWSFFNQIIIARKITNKFSVQVSPSISHFNAVEGYSDANGEVQPKMKNDHIAISFSGRYKVTSNTVIILNYDQPITKHTTDNPFPNISFGAEFNTSAHAFQVFFSNYYNIVPQLNNMYNKNDYQEGQFLIGFNITRLWSF